MNKSYNKNQKKNNNKTKLIFHHFALYQHLVLFQFPRFILVLHYHFMGIPLEME